MTRSTSDVRIAPGGTEFALMPIGPYSSARWRDWRRAACSGRQRYPASRRGRFPKPPLADPSRIYLKACDEPAVASKALSDGKSNAGPAARHRDNLCLL